MSSVKELSGVLAWQTAAMNAGGRPQRDFNPSTAPLSVTSSVPRLRSQSSLLSAPGTAAAALKPALAGAQIVSSAAEQLAYEKLSTKTPTPLATNTPDVSESSPALSLIEWEAPPHHGDSRSFGLLDQITALVPTRTSEQLVEEPIASESQPDGEISLIEWESPPRHDESRSLIHTEISEQVADGSDSHQSRPEMSLIDCESPPPYDESRSETTNDSPAIDFTQTAEYRRRLLNVCRTNIRRGTCEKPSFCIQRGRFHICPDFAWNGCSLAHPGETHIGGLHTCCRGFKQQDCGRPGCWCPNTVQLLHANFSCFAFRENRGDAVCLLGGEAGGCPGGHDNPDIRLGLERSYRRKTTALLPRA